MTVGKTGDGMGADHGLKPLPAPCQTERSALVSVTCGHYRAIEQTSQRAVADHQPLFSSRTCAGQGFRRTVLALGAPVRKLSAGSSAGEAWLCFLHFCPPSSPWQLSFSREGTEAGAEVALQTLLDLLLVSPGAELRIKGWRNTIS